MPRILITGAGSFIGSNFIKFSHYKDIDEISLKKYDPLEIDFSRYDVVLHLAAIVHQSKKIKESEYFMINRDLCLRVAKSARDAGIKQFIYLSTIKVYGSKNPSGKIRNEYSTCYPDDNYGRSKYEAETGLRSMQNAEFLVSIIRTPLVYGEGVKANMLSIIKLVDNLPILPLGGINNRRNFTYTENLTGFIDRIIEKKTSGTFIAMDRNAISTTDLVKHIAKYLRKKIFLIKIPDWAKRVCARFIPLIFDRLFNSMEFDNSETLKVLEFNPPFSTEEGLNRIMSSYLAKKVKFKLLA